MNRKQLTSRIISFLLAVVTAVSMLPAPAMATSGQSETNNSLEGKTLSVLGASISTYAGTSNGAAADASNSTIRDNAKYYPHSTVNDVTLEDTWWMQVADDLGLRLLVNNSWSGSSLLYTRNGTAGAYVDRCVQLHDDTGDNAGETPDIIAIQMGTNDFQYYKDTLGTADIDYDALITKDSGESYTYATPVTSLEAAAIVLHKISVRYPEAEVYYLNISQRVDGTDELIRAFNAELKQVVERFGAHVVDIYGSAITMAEFDTYIGDGRVHPNRLGMDAYTEAFKKVLLANTASAVDTCTVSLELDGVTADYGDDKIVVSGDSFAVDLTAAAGSELDVTVTMGGEDVTEDCYADGTVTIAAVTADVIITAQSVHTPQDYRWEFDGTDLASVTTGGNTMNTLTKNAGTTADGVFSATRYELDTAVVLNHDAPWVVEWKCEGTWKNSGTSSGGRMFTSSDVNADYNARYIFKSATNWLIAMGEKTTSGSHNYGIALADHGIDASELHTYRLENRIADDGSNMIWLSVDGEEIGAMTGYYIGTSSQGTTSDWLSGKDFVFPYMGTDTHGFTNCSIEYIQVWEGGEPSSNELGNELGTELFSEFSSTDFFLKKGALADGEEHVVAIYSNTNNARMAVIHLQDGATYHISVKNHGEATTKRMKICTFAECFSELMIAPLASERNMEKLDPGVVSVAQDIIFWDPNIGEPCVSEYEGTFVNKGNAKTMVLFAAWGADPSLVEVSVRSEDHRLEDDTDAGGNNLNELTQILISNMGLENEATKKIMEIAQGFWEHRGEFIYCSGTALDQPWNYWSYTGYVDSANTGKTVTAENAGYKRIDCSTFVRYVVNGVDYYSTPYFNALELTRVEQGGLDAGVDMNSEDPTVCRTDKMYIRPGKKMILEAKNNNYAFTKVFGYDASGTVIQTLETTAANTVFVPDERVEYLRAELKVEAASDYAPASAGVPAAILKCLRIREDERLDINAECPLGGYRNANQMCKWFDENGYAVEFDKNTFNVDDLRVGHVIFWGRSSGTWAYKNITHTSLYIGNGYILHVSAPYGLMGGEGILIEPIEKLMARYDIPLAAVSSPRYHTAANSHSHAYEFTVTAPTCSEQGYTTYTCACGDSYMDGYVEALGHSYSGIICTVCGTENPEVADYAGKVISILDDSISTFAGYIPVADGFNLEHLARYPQDNLLTDVNETWWMQVINQLNAKLGINDSWRGATVSGAKPVTTGTTGENAAMANLTRIRNLGSNGTPDVILFYGGTNDLAHVSEVGSFDAATAPSEPDMTTQKWDNLADGYVHTLLRMKRYYPDAEIVALLPTYTRSYYSDTKLAQGNAVLAEICDHYGFRYTDLRDCGITVDDLPDGIHPDATGMDCITDAVLAVLLESGVEAGENVVYSVSHELSGAKASLGYYKGISEGESFAEIITGDDLSVVVTMGGTDITDSCYADGKISIPAVTGNLVITAKGTFTADGHLQQLPEGICAGINLWTALDHNKEYYTASGWGVHGSGTVFSVTFPVTGGDQIYATSFGKAGENGSSMNGIRATFFFEDGTVKSLTAAEVYAEFSANGYITAPERAVAFNVPMWTNDDSNELYILSAEHNYDAAITAPTCTERGYTTHTCACGESYVDSYVSAVGHSYKNGFCTVCSEKETNVVTPLDSGLAVTVTPANYAVVSNVKVENLACAPCLVSCGEGKFAVAYLADEVNKIETEASTTIVCRVALFAPEHPEQAVYIDIATAGQTIGNVTIGSKAPYEPNLIALEDGKLLALFNLRTTAGKYIYYSAAIDPVSRTVTAYAPLTLDGREWTPANIAASYNALADSDISSAGPTGSMVFTSKIIRHDGYYYGYCGGVSSGFAGILVKSTDGINWTSVMTPEAAADMAGVIECGFRVFDEYVYFCMRDISSGIYHCSYNFSTGEQLVKTAKIPGLTTSKTDTFLQDGKLYVIVNKATGDDSSVGRRNTAQIYEVEPETCALTLMKQLFCADGIAYHSVIEYKGTNYWCFHTDARRIEPYTQGRSNLALVEMPALTTACDENGILQRDRLSGFVKSGCITAAANQWQAGVVNLSYQLPITCFTGCDTVTITANEEQKSYVAFFKSEMKQAGDIAYAEDWTNQVILDPGEIRTFRIPADATYLYILNNNAAGNDLFPAKVQFSTAAHEHTYTSVVTAPTCTGRGYTTHTCACGESYVSDYTDAMEHSYVNGVCSVCSRSVLDLGYTHAVPENQGIANAIDRAYQLTDVEWTPVEDMPGVDKINGEYTVITYRAGVTYRGIPYSGVIATDTYVGLNVSLESFLTALKNENSVLYTENLHSTNPKSATYFGTVCSKFAQYVLDVPGSYNTNNVANIPGMDTIAMPGEFTVDDIKLGDVVLHTVNHTSVCTDILYDDQGNVVYIEISEAVFPRVRRMLWSPEEFYEYFSGYRLCRYQYIDEVPAIAAVELDADYALMPRFGDKYNYKVSSAKGVVDVLTDGYYKAVILRDGVIISEIELNGASAFNFDRSVPGYLEMYLEKADGTRSSSVYACVTKSSATVDDASAFANGKLIVTIDGSCGTPLYIQVGSAHAIFCNVEGNDGTVEIDFPFSKVSTQQVRVAYQNEYGIYLSDWVSFTANENPSTDQLLSQGKYWNGYNITPSNPAPVVQENKVGYWSYTMIPVQECTTYYSAGATRMWFLDNNGNAISTYNAYKDGDVPFQFTTPVGTAYVNIAYSPDLVEQGMETLVHVHAYANGICTACGLKSVSAEMDGETLIVLLRQTALNDSTLIITGYDRNGKMVNCIADEITELEMRFKLDLIDVAFIRLFFVDDAYIPVIPRIDISV